MKTFWLLSTLVLLELTNLTVASQAAQSQLDGGSASLNQGSGGDVMFADAREDFEDWLERERRDDRDDNDRRSRRDRDDDDDRHDRQEEAREEWERRRDRPNWDDDDDDDDDDRRSRIRIGRDRDRRDNLPECRDPGRDRQGWRWVLEELGGCRN